MPPLDPIKARQRETWASGDYASVGAKIVYVAEVLCENARLQAGWRVLDVATGSGNAAIAAARRGCAVTGLDFAPNLLERARVRADAEGLEIELVEGDAEQLPFRDGAFDAVLSVFGVMFAPDQRRAAAELLRVCRLGGRIALASWIPTGFVAELFMLVRRYAPPPAELPSPLRWGDDASLGELLGPAGASRRSHKREVIFNFTTAEDYVAFFRARFGPVLNAFKSLAPDRQQHLTAEMVELVSRYDQNRAAAGPVAILGEYLESIITRA